MQKFDVVQSWLDNVAYSHSKNESTPYYYRTDLILFCEFIGQTPEQLLAEYERTDDREFKRKYAQYLRAFISSLVKNGYAPGSVKAKVAAVKSFFKYNDLSLGYVPLGNSRVIFHNREITKEEIAEVLGIADVRDAAFFSIMAQSGLRPITLTQLQVKHFEVDVSGVEPVFAGGKEACLIKVPGELAKGKYGTYFTFIPVHNSGKPSASVKYLTDYWKRRGSLSPDDYVFTSHGTDKPLHRKSISSIFARTVDKLSKKGILEVTVKRGKRPRSVRRDVRLYNLRKWFRKQAGQAGSDFVNFWMGHVLGVDEHYFPKDDFEHHRQIYIEKAMPYLRIETHTPTEQQKEIESLKQELKELREWKKQFGDAAIMVTLQDKAGVEKPTTHLIYSETKIKELLEQILLEKEKAKHSESI